METSTGAPGTTSQAQEKAQQVAGQAQEKAQQAAGQARTQLRTQVDQRSTQAGEQVTTTASDIRSVADQLRQQGKHQPAKLAEQAADRAERVGGYLKQSDADRILGDLEDFGRRQPLAVIFGGLALGFAASRFLKASSQNRYQHGPYRPPAPRPQAALPPSTAGRPVPPVGEPGLASAPPVPPAGTVPPIEEPIGDTVPPIDGPGKFERPGATTTTPGGGFR